MKDEKNRLLYPSSLSFVGYRFGDAQADGMEGRPQAGQGREQEGAAGNYAGLHPGDEYREQKPRLFQYRHLQDVPFQGNPDSDADDRAQDAHQGRLGQDGADDLGPGSADGPQDP